MNIRRNGYEAKTISAKSILSHDLVDIVEKYEKEIFSYLVKKEYEQCESSLSDFCYELLVFSDKEQVFVARVFFTGLITDIIRIQAMKKLLHAKNLSYAYETISKIEKWETISEYILHIPWFIERIKYKIISNHLLVDGNIHVEKALQLIDQHLVGDRLPVSWLAEQLGITTTHLSNLFKIQIGETIAKYIARRRIEEISYELAHTNKSLQIIREKYGFTNHSHFIQHFKNIKGVTPLQYIRELID